MDFSKERHGVNTSAAAMTSRIEATFLHILKELSKKPLESGIFGIKVRLRLISSHPKNFWDVSRGVKLTPFLRPFSGCHVWRVWCFHRRGQDPYGHFNCFCLTNLWSQVFLESKSG